MKGKNMTETTEPTAVQTAVAILIEMEEYAYDRLRDAMVAARIAFIDDEPFSGATGELHKATLAYESSVRVWCVLALKMLKGNPSPAGAQLDEQESGAKKQLLERFKTEYPDFFKK